MGGRFRESERATERERNREKVKESLREREQDEMKEGQTRKTECRDGQRK